MERKRRPKRGRGGSGPGNQQVFTSVCLVFSSLFPFPPLLSALFIHSGSTGLCAEPRGLRDYTVLSTQKKRKCISSQKLFVAEPQIGNSLTVPFTGEWINKLRSLPTMADNPGTKRTGSLQQCAWNLRMITPSEEARQKVHCSHIL